ncbi:WYL domain-containing protein [Streptomyces sp. RCPT1-4]|nr:WYL domain-containing protein [Streptomyces sennicomposti]
MALLLQSSPGLTAAALAHELDVSERTVIRDVQALQEAGVPVRSERGRAGGYRLAPGHRTRLTTLRPTEAETLYLSGLPTALRDLGLSDAADTARLKLAATLLPSLRTAAESSARRFHLDAPAWFREPSSPELLPELARAVWSDRAVELTYARPGRDGAPPRPVTRRLEPYGLVLKAGIWYVVGRVPEERGEGAGGRRAGAGTGAGGEAGEATRAVAGTGNGGGGSGRGGVWRTYRVDRVTALSPSPDADAPFRRDPSFDLAAHWRAHSEAFARGMLRTTVTLRLTEDGLRRLPAVLDPAAAGALPVGAPPRDAAGRVTLDVPVESEDVAFGQLTALGADAEVLAPASLRARFRAYARSLAARYDAEPDAPAPHDRDRPAPEEADPAPDDPELADPAPGNPGPDNPGPGDPGPGDPGPETAGLEGTEPEAAGPKAAEPKGAGPQAAGPEGAGPQGAGPGDAGP